MKYLSTRGGDERLTFEEAVLTGLAPNGGLYIPESIPALPENWKEEWKNASFVDLSFNVLSLFVPPTAEEGGIPPSDLRALIERSYSTFRDADVTPLYRLTPHEWCLELWHGPTFAFKDVALQLLGNLFEYFLARKNAHDGEGTHTITVLGATSGDTGSAAIAGLRSKANTQIFILHPHERVSPVQEAQMTTVLDENVHNLAVSGTFDDCQDIVKALFGDREFNGRHHLAAINSINWARIVSQIVYYFSAYFSLRRKQPDVDPAHAEFVVPTGNFGDILSGWYAKQLGLPMRRLVVATNENDILERFWSTGRYEKLSSIPGVPQDEAGVRATLSPAMDIQVSSNFERLLWYLAFSESHDVAAAGAQVAQWMAELKSNGRIIVSEGQLELARRDFVAERVSDQQTRETIRRYFEAEEPGKSYLVDPHTAVAFEAADRLARFRSPLDSQIVLSTAHPAKFSEAVVSSLATENNGDKVQQFFNENVLPPELRGLLEKERRVVRVRGEDAHTDETDRLARLIARTREIIEELGFQHS